MIRCSCAISRRCGMWLIGCVPRPVCLLLPLLLLSPAAAVAPPVVAAAVPVAAGDEVLDAVTSVVAEMTGYPSELLDPDLDLEADLGVDTVKQAEVFAAVRERYEVERDDSLQLRDFPTLRHVADWVRAKTGLPAAAPAASVAPVAAAAPDVAAAAAPVAAGDEVLDAVTSVVAEMTGYPSELLDPDLDLEADLGVDTVKQAEVFAAVRERYEVERDDSLQLRDFPTLRHVADWVRAKTGLPAAAPAVVCCSCCCCCSCCPCCSCCACCCCCCACRCCWW